MPRRPLFPLLLFALSGFAALSWELLWQTYSGFALGSSAESVALTIAILMGGMSVGAAAGGSLLARSPAAQRRPLVVLAVVEGALAIAGLLVPFGFTVASRIDTQVFRHLPALAVPTQLLSITLILGLPAIAMGWTVPLMRPIVRQLDGEVATLYGVNALGAVAGILAQTFFVLPQLGLRGAGAVAACVNLAAALGALRCAQSAATTTFTTTPQAIVTKASALPWARSVAFSTGFVTFALEVTWFRAFKAAFQSTTDSFAVMLTGFLLPLAVSPIVVGKTRARPRSLAWLLVIAGLAIVAVNPLVDRIDLYSIQATSYWLELGKRFALTVIVIGLPIFFLSLAFPLLLNATSDPLEIGRLYSVNTLGCVTGSITAAWVLLPRVGAYSAALLVGAALALMGSVYSHPRLRTWLLPSCLVISIVFFNFNSGVTTVRVQAAELSRELRPLVSLQGADATVSVAADSLGHRQLIIDGFQTSGEAAEGHYMAWMGHLPMLLHARPRRALVICFGTGQTANAVRRERPDALDLVELSPEVLAVSSYFRSNEDVLHDSRVRVLRTDGRAWLRRANVHYDVITLEPMEPHFAGTNDLYSLEFYRAAAQRLDEHGILAQWLPLHLLLPSEAASVVKTFIEIFPNSALWIDPRDKTGILVGRRDSMPITEIRSEANWSDYARDLSPASVTAGFALVGAGLRRYAAAGELISDDNQLLAYGAERRRLWRIGGTGRNHVLNLELVNRLAADNFRPTR
jgi:spermidine synthase